MEKIAVVGATGFVGIQIYTLLLKHKEVEKVDGFSMNNGAKRLSHLFPHLTGISGDTLRVPNNENLEEYDTVFVSIPFGKAAELVHNLSSKQLIIDLGYDFRLNPESYKLIYKQVMPFKESFSKYIQCIPEYNANMLKGYNRITMPGCVSTAILLGLLPIMTERPKEVKNIIVDAKVSSSGSGLSNTKVSNIHPIRSNTVRVTKLFNHRHKFEVEEFLKEYLGVVQNICLSVNSVDMIRGISCTIYFDISNSYTEKEFTKLYQEFYSYSNFVRVLKHNIGYSRYPDPKNLLGSNFCDIRVSRNGSKCAIIVALDNLMKGSASQAIQIFNLAKGYSEVESIGHYPIFPI